mgnify:CR=1 FL=1
MSRWKIVLVVLALLIAAVVAWRILHKPAATGAAANAPIPVTAVAVERRDVPVNLSALGTVQALNTVTVNAQVAGELMSINFTEGKPVKKGEVLAQIDPRTYQANYDQALAKKKQDEAQLATAQSTLKRNQTLVAKGYVAALDMDTFRNTVNQLTATVAADAASVSASKVQLGYTKVLSPIDGLAGIRAVDPGNVVSTSTAIVTLTQVHPINVLFTLPEQDLELVRGSDSGDKALSVIAMDRVDSHVVAGDGVLRVIDNQIDTSTGTFRLKSEFPNAKNDLWPGQFVNVRLQVNTVKGGLVIPTQAVQRGPDGDYVYLVVAPDAKAAAADTVPAHAKPGAATTSAPAQTVKMQPIKVGGDADDSHVLVTSGLSEGDQVVTEGQFRLKPGARVLALKPGEVPPPPTTAELDAAKKQGQGQGRRGR